jgi:hypothetical protein
MSETPQRHTHSGPGDGGSIDFSDRVDHPVEIVGEATVSPGDGVFAEIDTGIADTDDDGIGVSVTFAESDPPAETIASQLAQTSGEVGITYELSTDGSEYQAIVFNNSGQEVTLRVVVYRVVVPDDATTLDSRLQV